MGLLEAPTRFSVRVRLPRVADAIRSSLAAASCEIAEVQGCGDGVSVRVIVAADSETHARQRIANAVALGGTRLRPDDFIAASAEPAALALF